MKRATSYLESHGWDVEDVSAARSYDLHCEKGGECRMVEVKGTTTDGSSILLTPNEADLARKSCGSMILYVLSQIEVAADRKSVLEESGIEYVDLRWEIDDARLTPTGFSYRIKDS